MNNEPKTSLLKSERSVYILIFVDFLQMSIKSQKKRVPNFVFVMKVKYFN